MRRSIVLATLLAAALAALPSARAVWFSQVLEPGFVVTPLTTGLAAPTALAPGPDGNVYVVTLPGTVFRVRPEAPAPEPVVTGLDSPTGMSFGPDGRLYVSSTPPAQPGEDRPWGEIVSFEVVGATGPMTAADGTVVLERVPTGIHPLAGVVPGPDGLLYVGVGSASLNGDSAPGETPELEPLTMAVLRFDPADAAQGPLDARRFRGSGADPEHAVDVVAHGIHNPHDVAFAGGHLFTGSNAPQDQEPYGEDLILRVPDAAARAVADGTDVDFGSPGCLYRTGEDGEPEGAASDYPALPEHEKTCEGREPPLATLGLHTGPTGVATAPASFGTAGGDLFVALWGNLIPTADAPVAGHKVIRVGLDADGELERSETGAADIEDFLVGVSPIDVAFDETTMYVVDMALGAILRITPA